jgi:hypothetical protein
MPQVVARHHAAVPARDASLFQTAPAALMIESRALRQERCQLISHERKQDQDEQILDLVIEGVYASSSAAYCR